MNPSALRWVLWTAMLGSLAAYAAVLRVVVPIGEPAPAAIGPALAAIAGGLGAASFAVRALALSRPLRTGALDLATAAGQARFTTVSLVCWVLAEAVAIQGLVLHLLGAGTGLASVLVAAAAVLLVAHAPREIAARPGDSAELARPDVKIG